MKNQPPETNETDTPKANFFLFGMCLGVMTFWLFALAMSPLAPTISYELNIPLSDLTLPIGFAGLIAGIFIVPAGVLADRYSYLNTFRIGTFVCILGSLLCGIANDQYFLIIGRFLQGISAALIMPSTLALVKHYFSTKNQPRALSFWSMSSFSSAGLSSFFGGFIVTYMGWRWVFFLTIPAALCAFYLLRNAPSPDKQKSHSTSSIFDYWGFITLLLSLVAINLVINRIVQLGWNNLFIIVLFIAFIVLFPLFLKIEYHHKNPIVDLSLFKSKIYNTTVNANLLVNMGLGAMYILLVYLQKGRGLTAFEASLMTISYLIVILIMIRVGEKLGKHFGEKLPMSLGTCSSTIGYFLLACTFLLDTSYYAAVIIGFCFIGLGNGLFATPATGIAVSEAPPGKAGAATAIFKMASSLGGALGIAFCGAIYHIVLASDKLTVHDAGSYSIGFCAVALAIAFVLVLLFLAKKKEKTI